MLVLQNTTSELLHGLFVPSLGQPSDWDQGWQVNTRKTRNCNFTHAAECAAEQTVAAYISRRHPCPFKEKSAAIGISTYTSYARAHRMWRPSGAGLQSYSTHQVGKFSESYPRRLPYGPRFMDGTDGRGHRGPAWRQQLVQGQSGKWPFSGRSSHGVPCVTERVISCILPQAVKSHRRSAGHQGKDENCALVSMNCRLLDAPALTCYIEGA